MENSRTVRQEAGKPKAWISVVGGTNVDIGGRSFAPIVSGDSNPGRISVSFGGVGRNIAHNLSLLGENVRLFTALGEDLYAKKILASCEELGMDIRQARMVPGGSTSVYLYLDNPDGNMAVAMSDMEICSQITPAYLEKNLDLLNASPLVIVDANIPEETLIWLAEHCRVPIFADPVSTVKAEKLIPVLHCLYAIKPNRIEAEHMSGIEIRDETTLRLAARKLLDTGLRSVIITLGARGAFAAADQEMFMVPCFPAGVRNSTGAGDAFMAALAWGWRRKMSFQDACMAAAAAAAMTAESEETVCPVLSSEALIRKMEKSEQ